MTIRVVLVDDVEDVRALVRTRLRLRGDFEVVGEASSGPQAIEIVKQTQPDIVVLDLGLPELAGRDLVTKLREECPETKVVVYTGSSIHEESLIRPWVEGYALKHRDIDYLIGLVESVAVGGALFATASVQLERTTSSPAAARRFVLGRCQQWNLDGIVEDAVLVVSELVTNAVLHARSACEVRLLRRPSSLRIEVSDAGVGMPDLMDADEESEHGRGMVLTSAFCSAWGVETHPPSKVVWAELPLDAADEVS